MILFVGVLLFVLTYFWFDVHCYTLFMVVCELNGFVEDCLCRGFTRHTVETYSCNIREFFRVVGGVDDVDMGVLRGFLMYLRGRGLSDSTLNGYFAALNVYFDYLVFEGVLSGNPVPSFRRRYLNLRRRYNGVNSRQLIGVEEMAELVYSPFDVGVVRISERTHLWSVPVRDCALMMLFAKTGIRRGELLTLEVGDVSLEAGEVRVKPFAKRTNCLVFVDDEAVEVLRAYLGWREGVVRQGYSGLWVTHTGHGLRKDHPYQVVTFYAARLGLHDPGGDLKDKFTPHCFRHWFTTWLRRRGMSREHRRWLRGDAPGGADDLYDHIDPEDVKKEYLRCMPRLRVG